VFARVCGAARRGLFLARARLYYYSRERAAAHTDEGSGGGRRSAMSLEWGAGAAAGAPSYLITATVAADERDLSPRCRRCRGPPTTLPVDEHVLSTSRSSGARTRQERPLNIARTCDTRRLTDLFRRWRKFERSSRFHALKMDGVENVNREVDFSRLEN